MFTVFVGLSGGVDSAVATALLKSQGHNVTGVFIKIWQQEFIECTWKEDRLDAMRVAAALQIPFREVDLSESYKQQVIEDMLKGYAAGITPNPDVLCNERIKFGDFANWAFEAGADKIATGHYARILENNGEISLLRGVDPEKDQAYFLHSVKEPVLVRSLFPIGGMKKSDVRALARRFGLPNAARKDSQGLCFVGDVTLPEFLKRFISVTPGSVMDMNGNKIGTHDGAALYTIGQRHGFTTHVQKGNGKTHYVVSIDVPTNTLRVSENRHDAARQVATIGNFNWIGEAPTLPFEADIETHYHEAPFRAHIEQNKDAIRVHFSEPRVCSRGQSLVVYQGEKCLGGGVII